MKASSTFYPILHKEIAILKPDVVIFLTGDKLDKYLTHLFEGLIISNISKDLRKASHPLLPAKTYITHHPKRLRLKGIFNDTIKIIIKDANGDVVRTNDMQV